MQEINIFVGLPASGKTSFYFENKDTLFKGAIRLSLDDFRWQCTTSHFVPGFEPFAKAWIDVTGEYLLDHGHSLVIDATSIYASLRAKWIALGNKCFAKTTIWYFDTDIETCLKRNKGRKGEVPSSVIEFMNSKMEKVGNEGHDALCNVHADGSFLLLIPADN